MPAEGGLPHVAQDSKLPHGINSDYVLPVLATITAMSFMAAASASIGVWRDVIVMRESINTLVKDRDILLKKYESMSETLQEHEVRISKGKL
jgi:hypothetical protein